MITSTASPPRRLWSAQQLADHLGIPLQSLYVMRTRGDRGPRAIRVGRYIRFDPADVESWLASRKEAPHDNHTK